MRTYENEQLLLDEGIVDFIENCSSMDVNYLVSVRTMLNISKGELNFTLASVAEVSYGKLNMTKEEFINLTSQIASIGGLLRTIDNKLEIISYYMDKLTPDCFKNH